MRLLLCLLPAVAMAAVSPGIEGRLSAELPAGLSATADPQAPLMLRIAGREDLADGRCRYDLRYIGNEAGRHDLGSCLRDGQGRRPPGLPALPVEITALLPAGLDGELAPPPAEQPPPLGGWSRWLVAGGVVWLLTLAALLWRRRQPAAAPPAPPPDLATQLAPLVEAAVRGGLDSTGQARLERLLLAFWRERCGLEDLDQATALARLRAHPEAGALLRGTDAWLHQPPGRGAAVEVEALLAPYRGVTRA